MPRKISFINYKGGVGKTSLVVNLAAQLAQQGKRVLLVDLDAQSNSSIWLMRLDRWNPLNTAETGHLFSVFDPGISTLKDCVVKDVVRGKEGEALLPGLDLIPTTFTLVDLEHDFEAPDGRPAFAIFQEQLAEIENDYDFILFDCPPNVLYAAQCGIFCSSEIYVPANPDALSLIGFTLLIGKLQQFNHICASFRVAGMQPTAEVKGVIFNAIKSNVDIDVPKMRMQFRINQFKNQGRVAKDARIFDTHIRDAIIVRRAVTLGLPVHLVGKLKGEESVKDDYAMVAQELSGETQEQS
ncbi:chromosome partitioning protein [Coraliomargarita sinensis]|uniref:Chromosome partitioning protein n=1 Tax=Coraliomargarita sinensis TaxID=2174842 RepID=A0A317ZFA2_9BACT|nr:AAA family ATPase [Coraliomargarita sinensis]PXA04205.1 chromosome partitioning protein [Coraliomargarita sinensis]